MTRETEIVCALDVFEVGPGARHKELLALLQRSVEAHQEVEGGFAFRLPGDPAVFASMAELVTLERQCCGFIDFRLEWPAGAATFTFTMTGPEGTREILTPLTAQA